MLSKVENQFLNLSDREVILLRSIVANNAIGSNYRELKKYIADYASNGLLPLFYDKYDDYSLDSDKALAKKIKQESLLVETLTLNVISPILKKLELLNISVIVMKGWSLKKTLYGESYLRPASDIDLMIEPSDYKVVKEFFYGNGFFIANGWQPEFSKFQICLRKKLYDNNFIEVDLHFEFSPEAKLSNIINFNFLRENSTLAKYGDFHMYTLNYPMSLLHSIIHLALHIKNNENYKLIWFVDIYFLVNKMTPDDLKAFVELVHASGFNNVAVVFLSDLNNYSEFKVFGDLIGQIYVEENKKFDYIIKNDNSLSYKLNKYYSLYKFGGFKSVSQVLFPSEQHMHNKYGDFPRFLLIYYYLKRIVSAIFNGN